MTHTRGGAPAAAPSRGRFAARAHGLVRGITLSRGWRRLGLAAAAGALGALAMPPYGFLPALAASLSLAVWLLDGTGSSRGDWRAVRTAAVIGWAWGFGYMTAGLWWLGAAFLVEAEEFAWALPLGVLGLPAVLALFYAAGFAAARLLWSRGALRLLALGVGLAGAEWLRGHLFTGFPWNTLGMALGGHLLLMQGGSLVGLYGLTLLTVPIAAAPATLATKGRALARVGPTIVAGVALAGLVLFGAWRVPASPDPTMAGVRLRLVQPNIPQDDTFRASNREGIVDRYLALSAQPGAQAVTHLIWPESAFPFLIQRDPDTLERIGARLHEGEHLLTGAARASEPLTREHAVFFNAILTIEPGGTLGDLYDKVHLVPFGEYLPGPLDAALRAVGLRQFVSVPGGFTAGSRAAQRVLDVPGLPPVAATICYEAIFPGAILPSDASGAPDTRPGLILNLTNDAWFGDTPGPYQHLAQARLRAVEEGLPLVRDANSGISAVVDPYGRVTGRLGLGEAGVLDADLPAPLPGRTLYARYGDWSFAVLLLAASVGALLGRPGLRARSV